MPKKKISYDEAMNRLEEIVIKLEEGELPLEETIELYKEGIRLSALCKDKLDQAEDQILELKETLGGKITIDIFDGEAEEEDID